MASSSALYFFFVLMVIAVQAQEDSSECSSRHPVNINERPWIADLDGCTGIIIGEYWILTAAHCAYDNYTGKHRPLQVARVGSHYGDKGRRVSINESFEHPKYDLYNSIQYDFLLLRLSKGLVFGHRVRPAKLAGAYARYLEAGVNGYVLGFGHFSDDDDSHTYVHDSPKRLISQGVELMPIEECRRRFEHVDLHAVTMCARAYDNQCEESGGPLMVDDAVVGVAASVSERACSAGDPILFASVPLVRNWIRYHMNGYRKMGPYTEPSVNTKVANMAPWLYDDDDDDYDDGDDDDYDDGDDDDDDYDDGDDDDYEDDDDDYYDYDYDYNGDDDDYWRR